MRVKFAKQLAALAVVVAEQLATFTGAGIASGGGGAILVGTGRRWAAVGAAIACAINAIVDGVFNHDVVNGISEAAASGARRPPSHGPFHHAQAPPVLHHA